MPSLNDSDLESEASTASTHSQQLHHAFRLVRKLKGYIHTQSIGDLLGKSFASWMVKMKLHSQAFCHSHVQGRLQPRGFHSC